MLAILWLLKSGRRMTAKTIADRLEMHVRTVYRYIDTLCASGVPIIADSGHNGGYRLLRPTDETLLFFDKEEQKALVHAAQFAEKAGYPYEEALTRAVAKLAETLTGPIQSVFPSLRDALLHMYRIDNVWLKALSSLLYPDIVDKVSERMAQAQSFALDELEQAFEALGQEFLALVDSLEDVEAVKEYPHPTFGTLRAPHSEIVEHIVNHGTYHRGNLTAMLRQLGHQGVPTDYVFYLYQV
nr:DinB family protein [Cohnella massiliensis]